MYWNNLCFFNYTERDIVLQMLTAAHPNSEDVRLKKVYKSEQACYVEDSSLNCLRSHL